MSDQSTGEIRILIFFASLVIGAGGLLYRLTYDVATDQLRSRNSAQQCIHAVLGKSGDHSVSGDSVSAQVDGDVQSLDRKRGSNACVVTVVDRDHGNVKTCGVVTFPNGETTTNCSRH